VATPHDPYAALRSPNYRLFASGFIVSSTGLQMLSAAVAWDIYDRTHNLLALGYIGLARAIPVILLALPAGHAVDVFDRKRVLILTQSAFAVLAAFLAVASYQHAPVWVFYALLVLTGCARVFNGPSRSSLLPLIVNPGDFHNAVTWNSGAFQFAAMVGPIAAGFVIAQFAGAWPVYVIVSAACAIFAFTSSFIRPRPSARSQSKFTLAAMAAGLGHVWREKTVFGAITLDLFAVLLGGATALMPAYAKDVLQVGSVGYGWLRAAPFVGAFIVSLVIAQFPPFKRAGPALLWSVAGFGAATIGFGLSTSFLLSLAMLFVLGAVDNISVVIRHVLVQVRTPDHLRGRVSAVNSVFIESSNELGAFESGLVAHYLGPMVSVVSGGVGTLIVVAIMAITLPELRKLGRLREPDLPPDVTNTPPDAPGPQ
jgi:MFS family permease